MESGSGASVGTRVGYKLEVKTQKLVNIILDGETFSADFKGQLYFQRIKKEESSSLRLLQIVEELSDSNGMPIDLESQSFGVDFNYADYQWEMGIKKMISNISKFMNNFLIQLVIYVLRMQSFIFSFSVNIFNKLLYFRCLRTVIPLNLSAIYDIMGIGLDVKSSPTDYSNPENYQATGMDKIFGIELTDQNPPEQFKNLYLTDIYIKSALPILLINCGVYIFVLILSLINKNLKMGEVQRLERIAAEQKDNKNVKGKELAEVQTSACKRAIIKTFALAEKHFKWSVMIKMNLLIY